MTKGMSYLNLNEWRNFFTCPACKDQKSLTYTDAGFNCPTCGKSYPVRDQIIEFVDPRDLEPEKVRELSGNTVELTPENIQHYSNKENWSTYYTHCADTKFAYLLKFLAPLKSRRIVAMGSGSGYDLKNLLKKTSFDTVFCSDLSFTVLSIAPVSLADFDINACFFTADLDTPPIRDKDTPFLVYEALHHTPNPHLTVENLLETGFENIFFVEPVINKFTRWLTGKGLAQRVEYSGVTPQWLDLKKIRELCRRYGYSMQVKTVWEFPEDYFRKFSKSQGLLQKVFLFGVDVFSKITGLFNFGSIAIAKLSKD